MHNSKGHTMNIEQLADYALAVSIGLGLAALLFFGLS
jgi:hypothetical protein